MTTFYPIETRGSEGRVGVISRRSSVDATVGGSPLLMHGHSPVAIATIDNPRNFIPSRAGSHSRLSRDMQDHRTRRSLTGSEGYGSDRISASPEI
ncbi:MAG: hypothetical protein CMJ89_14290 [Planctomycetes bacterium]|nr:hypothetical protein [Planctomycetota bacterium]